MGACTSKGAVKDDEPIDFNKAAAADAAAKVCCFLLPVVIPSDVLFLNTDPSPSIITFACGTAGQYSK
jgi:hypothetical protein